MPAEQTELRRLRMLPWSRVVTAKPGGGYRARVRELGDCRAEGDSPVEALARLEEELDRRLEAGARGDVTLPSPNFWDPSTTEAFPVRLPRRVVEAAQAEADRDGISLNEYVERLTIAATARRDGDGAEHQDSPQPPATEALAEHGTRSRDVGLVDRLLFPEATSSEQHWQRMALSRSVTEHLIALGPAQLTAAEISGNSHARLPWKSYESLDFPEFDLAAPLGDRERYDVVICEQVLEHVRDVRTAVANLRALARPGGHVIVSTPFLIRVHELEWYEMYDYWRFTPRGLATLLEEAGLVVDEVHDWGNRWCVYGNLGHWAARRRWHPMRREPDVPVQVWAFARSPG